MDRGRGTGEGGEHGGWGRGWGFMTGWMLWRTKHLSLEFQEGHLQELYHWLRKGRGQTAAGCQEGMRRGRETASVGLLFEAVGMRAKWGQGVAGNGFKIKAQCHSGTSAQITNEGGVKYKGREEEGKGREGKGREGGRGGSVSFGLELIKVLFCFLKTLHTVTHFSCDNSSDTISFYNFDLHFSDYWFWRFFNVLVGPLYVFFWDMSTYFFI